MSRPWRIPLLSLSLVLFLGFYFASPYPLGGDSSELLGVACEGGIAHPPGYPLWTILNIGAARVGSVAGVNGLNFGMGALAFFILWMSLRPREVSVPAFLMAVGLFVASPLVLSNLFWTEVFSLQYLLVAAMLFHLSALGQTRTSDFVIAGFLGGLCASHHHTSLFFFPLYWLCLFFQSRALTRIPLIFGGFSLGLLPYLYLFLRPGTDLQLNFSWGDTATIGGFLRHFFRFDYGTFQLGTSALTEVTPTVDKYLFFFRTIASGFDGLGLLFVIAGVWHLYRKDVRGRLITWSFGFFALVFPPLVNYSVTEPASQYVVSRMYLLPLFLLIVPAAYGIQLGLNQLRPRMLPWIVALIGFGWIGVDAVRSFPRDAELFHASSRRVLEQAPLNAVVLMKGDLSSHLLRFQQACHALRPEITLIDVNLLTYSWWDKSPTAKKLAGRRGSGLESLQGIVSQSSGMELLTVGVSTDLLKNVSDRVPVPWGQMSYYVPQAVAHSMDFFQKSQSRLFEKEYLIRWSAVPKSAWAQLLFDDQLESLLRFVEFWLWTPISHQMNVQSELLRVLEDYLNLHPRPRSKALVLLGEILWRKSPDQPDTVAVLEKILALPDVEESTKIRVRERLRIFR